MARQGLWEPHLLRAAQASSTQWALRSQSRTSCPTQTAPAAQTAACRAALRSASTLLPAHPWAIFGNDEVVSLGAGKELWINVGFAEDTCSSGLLKKLHP